MTRLFVAAVGADTASFLMMLSAAPLRSVEVNALVVAAISVFGTAAIVGLKLALGVGTALVYDHYRPRARFYAPLVLVAVLLLVGAVANVATLAQVLA